MSSKIASEINWPLSTLPVKDYRHPVRKSSSLHDQVKSQIHRYGRSIFLSATSAQFFRHLWFMPSLGVRSPCFLSLEIQLWSSELNLFFFQLRIRVGIWPGKNKDLIRGRKGVWSSLAPNDNPVASFQFHLTELVYPKLFELTNKLREHP